MALSFIFKFILSYVEQIFIMTVTTGKNQDHYSFKTFILACKKSRVGIAIDSTNLHHFDVLQKLVYNVFRLFEYGSSLSLLPFGSQTDDSLAGFRSYPDLPLLQMVCQLMGYRGIKGRKTGAALKRMTSIFGGAAAGSEKQLLFLFITGKSEDDVIEPARNLVKKGVSIFAIGIGDSVDANELKTISRYYLTTKWRGLVTSLVKVQNTVIKGMFIVLFSPKILRGRGTDCTDEI